MYARLFITGITFNIACINSAFDSAEKLGA